MARNNFGCGSSREHAVWAVLQAGFHVVIAPRLVRYGSTVPAFADIFANNAVKNGLLTVELGSAEVDEIFKMVARLGRVEMTVDLDEQRVILHFDEEITFHFDLDNGVKSHLLRGLDEIALTLEHEEAISGFEAAHRP